MSQILSATSTYHGQSTYEDNFPLETGDTFYGECGVYGVFIDNKLIGAELWVFETKDVQVFSTVLIPPASHQDSARLDVLQRQLKKSQIETLTIENNTTIDYHGSTFRIQFEIITSQFDTTNQYIEKLAIKISGYRTDSSKRKTPPIQSDQSTNPLDWLKRLFGK